MQVGWIGLGEIGGPMARRALLAGHRILAYERGQAVKELRAGGVALSRDYTTIAAACEVLTICLFNDAQVKAVLLDQGALAAMRPGSVLVLHTTGSPELARQLQDAAPEGVAVLDATFSGSPAQAEHGTLTIMVGGATEAVARAQPLLASYAARVHHVGLLGQGQVVKLLNNLLFAANLRFAAEVLGLAERQGLDPGTCARIFQGCSSASTAGALFADAGVAETLDRTHAFLSKDVATAADSLQELGLSSAMLAPVIASYVPD
jgi:3-hydroxyisobutyrate dehydrogenase-like beta-hydroxyacid dehydrogenase